MAVARGRLTLERKNWRRDHPFGFVAKPFTNEDGSTDMMRWQCKVPGKEGTAWEGGLYPVEMLFSEDYPSLPPTCKFPAGFFHPNVYDSGAICLSIINADADWAPSITIKQILLGIQELLTTPNINSAAQRNAYNLYKTSQAKYISTVKAQAQKYLSQD